MEHCPLITHSVKLIRRTQVPTAAKFFLIYWPNVISKNGRSNGPELRSLHHSLHAYTGKAVLQYATLDES